MPGQAGAATTLYTMGVIAELWNYHSVFYVAMAMTAGAVWCLWRIKDV
ncbi:Sugar efflux transporter B [Cronobacter dublinensis 582]|nr:Sugar efflux transporter B [Cronobacter dublinensis 582]